MSRNTTTTIYKGLRGEPFYRLIKGILRMTSLKETYYSFLLDEHAMNVYDQVFTHKSANALVNYEHYEFLGDVTLNKCVAWYLSRKFPQLNCPLGVKVLTRLKINLISKKSFATFAKRLSMWNFVSVDSDTRENNMDKTLEDVFESFFGATETLLDERVCMGAGYVICYSLIKNLLDGMNPGISLKYEDLFDAKTRLKELFDQHNTTIGTLKYGYERQDRIHRVCIYQLTADKEEILLSTAEGTLKASAQQKAAEKALVVLEMKGFKKYVPPEYLLFETKK